MIITIQGAVPRDDYMIEITMTNGNHLIFDMLPHLDTVQFMSLKDKTVWKNVVISGTCLRWTSSTKVELSIDELIGMINEGKNFGQGSSRIEEASADDSWMLRIQFDNGNRLEMDVRRILEYSLFAPLSQRALWKTMQTKAYSLQWKNESINIELPVNTILHYFA